MTKFPTNERAVLVGAGVVNLETAENLPLRPSEVRVKMHSATICGSDISYFMHGRSGSFEMTTPFVLGHEGAGTVAEIGTEVTGIQVGDDIAINPAKPCRVCAFCIGGRSNLCGQLSYLGSASTNPPVDGLFARYLVVETSQCLPIPPNLPLALAPLVEPASVAMHAVNRSRLEPGAPVVIIGAGAIGLLCLKVAAAVGASSVSVVDPSEIRQNHALREGAAAAVDPSSIDKLPTPHVVFECSGTSAGLLSAVEKVRRGGTVVQVGGMLDATPIPGQLVMSRELAILGSFRFAEESSQVMELIQAGHLSLDGLIEGEKSFAEVEDALRTAASGEFVKVALRFEE